MMKAIGEKDRMSLAQCKKVLCRNDKRYSDEEILKIRNWIYEVAEFTLSFMQSRTNDELIRIERLLKEIKE